MILAESVEITSGVNTLYAGFLAFAGSLLVVAANWLRNLKPRRQQKSTLETIKSELTLNGGSSIKDLMLKTHDEVVKQGNEIKNINETIITITSSQRARLEMQLDQSNDISFLWNENGELTFASKKLQELFGMSRDDIQDEGYLKAIENASEKKRIREAVIYSTQHNIAFNDEWEITNQKNRQKIKVIVYSDPKFDDNEKLLWNFGRIKVKE